jgi:hypothetical protein
MDSKMSQEKKSVDKHSITLSTNDHDLPITNIDSKYVKEKMPIQNRTRSVMVTLWDDYWDEESFKVDPEEQKHVQWLVVGAEEKCPTTGRTHFHAVAQCTRVKSIKQWTEIFQCTKIKVLPRKGTFSQCYKYITKDGPPVYEYGKLPVQGARKDLHELRDAYKGGKTDKEVIEDDTLVSCYARHMKFAEKCKRLYAKPRRHMTECIWYHGPSGTGKSTMAEYNAEKEAPDDVYLKPAGKWWDDYKGQKIVIIEDLKIGEMEIGDFCRLIDCRPLKVPVKNGFENFTSTKVYVTSNYKPTDIFHGFGIKRRTKDGMKLMENMMHPEQAKMLKHELFGDTN